jgi:hypothetical protein
MQQHVLPIEARVPNRSPLVVLGWAHYKTGA